VEKPEDMKKFFIFFLQNEENIILFFFLGKNILFSCLVVETYTY